MFPALCRASDSVEVCSDWNVALGWADVAVYDIVGGGDLWFFVNLLLLSLVACAVLLDLVLFSHHGVVGLGSLLVPYLAKFRSRIVSWRLCATPRMWCVPSPKATLIVRPLVCLASLDLRPQLVDPLLRLGVLRIE